MLFKITLDLFFFECLKSGFKITVVFFLYFIGIFILMFDNKRNNISDRYLFFNS